MPVTNASVLPSLGMCMVVASQGAPEQEGADNRDQYAACSLELGRAPAISECPTDNGETRKHQDKSEPDMGQREYRTIGDALSQLGWLSEVVGH